MLKFHIIDVFAEQKYQGNQLAVFENATHLSDNQMLTIAREINFQETTFVLSNQESENGFDVKIFTPEYEVPFAGHPTLGTAHVLMQMLRKDEVILNLKIGGVPVKKENESLFLKISNPQFLRKFQAKEITKLFNLLENSINKSFPLQVVSTGLPYLIVPLNNLTAIKNLNFDTEKIINFLKINHLYKDNSADNLTTAFFFYTIETEKSENQIHARMFCLENGMMREDAATGSANSCLLAYLLSYESPKISKKVEQGYEMNRPSLIEIRGEKTTQNEFILEIGGRVQTIAKGEWFE